MHERRGDHGPPSPCLDVGEVDNKIFSKEAKWFHVVMFLGLFLSPMPKEEQSAAQPDRCKCEYVTFVFLPIGGERRGRTWERVCRALLNHGYPTEWQLLLVW